MLTANTTTEAICSDCRLETDVILESSDGVQYGAHSRNLEVYSEGFPSATFARLGPCEVVWMEENSQVVKLLLQYMHLMPQPNVKTIPFEVFEQFTDAVEKYLIHSAIQVCRLRME